MGQNEDACTRSFDDLEGSGGEPRAVDAIRSEERPSRTFGAATAVTEAVRPTSVRSD